MASQLVNNARPDTVEAHRRAVDRVIQAMHQNLAEEFSLEDMAGVAYISPYHFNRVFHQVAGVPPCQYLSALRLWYAKRLLLTTPLKVTDICFEVGYNSLGTFTRRFTDLVGVPPQRLRALARSGGLQPLMGKLRAALAAHAEAAAAGTADEEEDDDGLVPGHHAAGNGHDPVTGNGNGNGHRPVSGNGYRPLPGNGHDAASGNGSHALSGNGQSAMSGNGLRRAAGNGHGTPAPGAGGPGLVGRVRGPADFRGPVFIGLFATPLPQGRPLACTVLAEPGRFHISHPPDGTLHVFAAAVDPEAHDAAEDLLFEHALRGAAGGRVVEVRHGSADAPVDLALRLPEPFDPPILLTLPVLLAERLASAPATHPLRVH